MRHGVLLPGDTNKGIEALIDRLQVCLSLSVKICRHKMANRRGGFKRRHGAIVNSAELGGDSSESRAANPTQGSRVSI
jgi:hypothetical protein